MTRRISRTITVRGLPIGGGNPVSVQSMTNTKTDDVEGTLAQIRRLEAAGCQIVRLAVPNRLAARSLPEIRRGTDMPLVADIHFDYTLALAAVEAGFDKIRINPGNIGSAERVRRVADACRDRGVPIRVGVNSGSVEKELLDRYGLTARALCESALGHVRLLEDCGFEDICISVKASDPVLMVETNRLLARSCDYPLHIGVTEAGTLRRGILKSAAGIGSLLLDGIGDTIRISLTDAPEEEAAAGVELLRALGLRRGVQFVSCPTCGRTEYDLIGTAKRVEELLRDKPWDITVAVMGCIVNGPGEASHADYGIAGGKGEGILFKHGVSVRKVPEGELADALLELIESENR
ncbi:MAG: flavodoxin-dependent (E)-4-hydroxy-3-methylbut-2-enyl-diphosphate synthase [Oscillospiraceae bacterium]|nr:flavodoxin-dependent (E)-4-hydroxy-3-methylbut-2-enyl-diphosphate synthase [Oscillospiraceae bacterium]